MAKEKIVVPEVQVSLGKAKVKRLICQWRIKSRPLGRRKREPVGAVKWWFSGEEGLWSVAEEALLPRSAFVRIGSAVLRRVAFASALLEPIAVAVHFQDVDTVGDAVQQCAGETL